MKNKSLLLVILSLTAILAVWGFSQTSDNSNVSTRKIESEGLQFAKSGIQANVQTKEPEKTLSSDNIVPIQNTQSDNEQETLVEGETGFLEDGRRYVVSLTSKGKLYKFIFGKNPVKNANYLGRRVKFAGTTWEAMTDEELLVAAESGDAMATLFLTHKKLRAGAADAQKWLEASLIDGRTSVLEYAQMALREEASAENREVDKVLFHTYALLMKMRGDRRSTLEAFGNDLNAEELSQAQTQAEAMYNELSSKRMDVYGIPWECCEGQ
ncbi:hypothetical protein [Aliikangiella coralliicola]|uniref:Uncharacterized protein n=1 Tax=Aliikangiella coralliicola TaxID=2592383 RepID=A0A545UCD7_9GAMM|nr:hypothetical protein [Aliikangiella coralliicola]TQV87129.1 hypothetical protein FLL46_15095 [Aliikangiella coralliicola]